jgi:hypothetical protein
MAQLKTTESGQTEANAQIEGAVVSTVKSPGNKSTDELAKACDLFAAAGTPTKSSGLTGGKTGAGKPVCGKKAAGDHSTAASSDEDPCHHDKADLTQFYGDVSNGVALGMVGLVVGSFFGGPLVFAAFALAAGVSGYYLSKSINKKDDKK